MKRKTTSLAGHYLDVAEAVQQFRVKANESERGTAKFLKLSKSQVHRFTKLASLPDNIKQAARKYNIEMYVLIELAEIKDSTVRSLLANRIKLGQVLTRSSFRTQLRQLQVERKGRAFPGTVPGRYTVKKHV